MRAWQFEGAGKPIKLNEVPEPTPGPGEVVIDMKAAGMCHSDLMYMEIGQHVMPFLPMTQGHENAGVISAVGEGVTDWKVGDLVGVNAGGERPLGMFAHGGYADKLLASVADLARIPAGLDMSLAALGTDAGMTSYHAIIKEGHAGQGMKVGVFGYGGLGQIGARAAVLKGAEVHVAEMKEDVWPLARAAGAVDVVKDAAEWAGQNFDVVVDYAGFDPTQKAVDAVRMGGVVVQVGLGTQTFTVQTATLLGKTIIGSRGGTVQDIEEVYRLLLDREIEPAYTVIPFEEVGDGLERLRRNEVTGRLVVRISD